MGARLESDALVALRRLRRHLTVWRLLTVAGFALALFLAVDGSDMLPEKPHVARVAVEGIIVNDRDMIDMLDAIADDASARALVVDISSPGGTFTGGDAMFQALRRVADHKPVVAVMGDMATSGAYMTAIAADRIFAGRGTITGSIGVIMQTADVTGLLDKIGVKPETMKSGALKATPNPMETLQPAARQQLQDVINELHLHFMEMVAARRGMTVAQVREKTGDGRIMTGDAALRAGLVDAIGDVGAARDWLTEDRGVPADLPLLDWAVEDSLPWWHDGASSMASAIFGKSLLSERLRLDGIQALWQPSLSGGR